MEMIKTSKSTIYLYEDYVVKVQSNKLDRHGNGGANELKMYKYLDGKTNRIPKLIKYYVKDNFLWLWLERVDRATDQIIENELMSLYMEMNCLGVEVRDLHRDNIGMIGGRLVVFDLERYRLDVHMNDNLISITVDDKLKYLIARSDGYDHKK